MDVLWLIFAFLTALVGCAALAISQDRNWRVICDQALAIKVKRKLRISGWACISLSLLFSVLRDGGSFAALVWPLLLAASSFIVAMMLAYKPKFLGVMARAASR